MDIKLIFTDTGAALGAALGVEGGATFEEAKAFLEGLKNELGDLVALGLIIFEGDIEQHKHDEHHVHTYAHVHNH